MDHSVRETGLVDSSPPSQASISRDETIESGEKIITDFDSDALSFDRGLQAWLQVFASWLLFFNTWGIVTAFGVFQTYYEQEVLSHRSPSAISWIGSTQSFLLLFIGAVTGPLFDAGYSRQLLFAGMFLVPFGLMMTSISQKFWHILLAQGFCVGIGCGCLFMPCLAIIPQYFKQKRAFASGAAATGSGVGGVLYPIIFRQLQLRIGFAWAARVLGFVSFGMILVSFAILQIRFQPTEKRSLIQLSAFKDPVYSLFCVSQFVGIAGLYNVMVYVQSYAIKNNIMSDNLAFYLLALLNTASACGRVLPNYFVDYVGPLNIIFPMALVSSLLAFSWIAIYSSAGIIALVVLYGFFTGGYVSIAPVVIMTITPDLRDYGTRLGMSFIFVATGALIGTPIGGAIVSFMHGDYLGAKIFAGVCLFSSGVLMAATRFTKTGPRLFAKA
ncbi:hypothetical protein LOZ58_005322 [Ophidiomyces ophidiicola]|nr:hypothetical protein LOZ66_005874 [Ophidiomyces ophidiicola]KAI1958207.1 hypothetical protein LOZ58_005322 [Ophidiomyces ophidiicola]